MIILGIETSCDETAVSVVEGSGGRQTPHFRVLAHLVSSQTAIHVPWGGVVPTLAKREHSKNLIPVLKEALEKSKLLKLTPKATPWRSKGGAFNSRKIEKILAREPELLEQFLKFIPTISPPKINAIAVTYGPGLEPALWAGINFARALALAWQKPLIPINHLEGHICSVLAQQKATPWGSKGVALKLKFPALALLISGGHTELILVRDWFKYRRLGATRDDAAGECFDKVARLLGLSYPGGPALSKLARSAQGLFSKTCPKDSPWAPLPRPMITLPNFDFSFSGLKTAVLYRLREIPRTVLGGHQGQFLKTRIAADFEQAVIDVLLAKTAKAIKKYKPKTLIIAGGVAANKPLRRQFANMIKKLNPPAVPTLLIPPLKLSTDNATMIAIAGYLRLTKSFGSLASKREAKLLGPNTIRAHGNLTLD